MAGDPAPLLDESVLSQLGDDIGLDAARDVTGLFLAEAPRMIERLEQALVTVGRPLLRELHTPAGAAYSVGLMPLALAAVDIEQAMASEEPSLASLTNLTHLLRVSVARLESWAAS